MAPSNRRDKLPTSGGDIPEGILESRVSHGGYTNYLLKCSIDFALLVHHQEYCQLQREFTWDGGLLFYSLGNDF